MNCLPVLLAAIGLPCFPLFAGQVIQLPQPREPGFGRPSITETFHLNEGVNIIGFPLSTNLSIPELFAPLIEDGLLERVEDDRGRFYLPAQNFCNLLEHIPTQGYAVTVSEDCNLEVSGRRLPHRYRVRLRQGLNLVVYHPLERGFEVGRFLNWLPPEVIMIRDQYGSFCVPSRNFNNIRNISHGHVLEIQTSSSCIFHWPEE